MIPQKGFPALPEQSIFKFCPLPSVLCLYPLSSVLCPPTTLPCLLHLSGRVFFQKSYLCAVNYLQ